MEDPRVLDQSKFGTEYDPRWTLCHCPEPNVVVCICCKPGKKECIDCGWPLERK